MEKIDYRQLMFGNWVFKKGKYYQVKIDSDNRLILENPYDGGQLPITSEGIEGIPFNNTILESNGFIKKKDDWRFERTDLYFAPIFDGTGMKLRFYQLNIQYFHELQNFFTLYGFNSIALKLSPLVGIFKLFINAKFGDEFKLSDGSIALWLGERNPFSVKLYVENYGCVDFDITTGEGKDVDFEALFVTEKL
jgi:hypothetical protein